MFPLEAKEDAFGVKVTKRAFRMSQGLLAIKIRLSLNRRAPTLVTLIDSATSVSPNQAVAGASPKEVASVPRVNHVDQNQWLLAIKQIGTMKPAHRCVPRVKVDFVVETGCAMLVDAIAFQAFMATIVQKKAVCTRQDKTIPSTPCHCGRMSKKSTFKWKILDVLQYQQLLLIH